jgi:hydroxyacylglutathione hydrolase
MKPIVKTYAIGQMGNNTYLFGDPESKQAVLIDPSFGSSAILPEIKEEGWQVSHILLTHAHFDHTYGIYELSQAMPSLPPIALHRCDKDLYESGGLGELMGLQRDLLPQPAIWLEEGAIIPVGSQVLITRHCPGHTPGHVFFYSESARTAFVGDIIFFQGIGRTDLPGGSETVLLKNIAAHIFSLPAETHLLPGHGPATSVAQEREGNPFL